jgi:hypothetical protein
MVYRIRTCSVLVDVEEVATRNWTRSGQRAVYITLCIDVIGHSQGATINHGF